MKTKNFLVTIWLLAFLVITSTAVAQTPIIRQLEVSAGGSLLARQDLVFSPFVHRGASPISLGLAYRRTRNWEQTWHLAVTQFSIQQGKAFDYTLPLEPGETFRTGPHGFTFADLAYTFGKPIIRRQRSTWSIGGGVTADIDALNYVHARVSNFGYFMAFDLGLWSKWTCQPTARQGISAEVQLPLMAWVARSPYLINDDDFIENTASHRTLRTLGNFIGDGQWAGPGRYQRASLLLRYEFALNPRWRVGAGFQSELLRYDRPLPLRVVEQRFSLNVSRSL